MSANPRMTPKARMRWDARERRYLLVYPERGLLLSDTAAAILSLCDGAHSIEEIAAELSTRYPDSEPSAIRADVQSFLEEMRRRGLVEKPAP